LPLNTLRRLDYADIILSYYGLGFLEAKSIRSNSNYRDQRFTNISNRRLSDGYAIFKEEDKSKETNEKILKEIIKKKETQISELEAQIRIYSWMKWFRYSTTMIIIAIIAILTFMGKNIYLTDIISLYNPPPQKPVGSLPSGVYSNYVDNLWCDMRLGFNINNESFNFIPLRSTDLKLSIERNIKNSLSGDFYQDGIRQDSNGIYYTKIHARWNYLKYNDPVNLIFCSYEGGFKVTTQVQIESLNVEKGIFSDTITSKLERMELQTVFVDADQVHKIHDYFYNRHIGSHPTELFHMIGFAISTTKNYFIGM